jgi:glycosyltransferase involved in cell wall biosynthesis
MNELITIAICVYNAQNFLENTLASLKNQTYKDLYYLIIDDGSTDNSKIIIDEFIKGCVNSQAIFLPQNRGTAYARNLALNTAKTSLMNFFDSDDVAKPEMVEELYSKFKKEQGCIAVSCYAQYLDENGKALNGGLYIGPTSREEFLEKAKNSKMIFMSICTLFDRISALKVGGYRTEGFPVGKLRYQDLSEDLDLWSRMSDLFIDGKIMLVIPKVLFYYRKQSRSLSTSKDNQLAMHFKIKYIKYNLKQRRSGGTDIYFNDYMKKLKRFDRFIEYKNFYAEYFYRKSAYSFLNRRYMLVILNLLLSFLFSPRYGFQKYQSNIKRGKIR